jgi:hypothetical protein
MLCIGAAVVGIYPPPPNQLVPPIPPDPPATPEAPGTPPTPPAPTFKDSLELKSEKLKIFMA